LKLAYQRHQKWTHGNNENPLKNVHDLELPVVRFTAFIRKALDGHQISRSRAIVRWQRAKRLKAAVFTGENLIAQIGFFSKKAVQTRRHLSS
jgi:hypothetical protein